MALTIDVQLVGQAGAAAAQQQTAPERVVAVKVPEAVQLDSRRRQDHGHIRLLVTNHRGLYEP
ncbi:hypothetical protein [Streptomyces sp. MZ04]|uniref:hypothetical protein n=1 Tax=Streptomyces sp. MZ04 TaxID=2559236 RepID=UPI00107EE935|nr:hypothetical protein [Streptomyces sp. MZ04]TGB03227.1 hypothetical protein E2651_25710 [Streptomyces sp. MZ04]